MNTKCGKVLLTEELCHEAFCFVPFSSKKRKKEGDRGRNGERGRKGKGAHTSALYLSICEAIFSAGNVGLSSVFYKVVT